MLRNLGLFLFVLTFGVHSVFGQVNSSQIKVDSILKILEDNLELISDYIYRNAKKAKYKMYQTDNIYNLLQLDTETGRIEQVQWSLNSSEEGSVYINEEDLSLYHYGPGSFELYPTKNMYQFILLDNVNGRKWHVQWGMKSSERWIKKIY